MKRLSVQDSWTTRLVMVAVFFLPLPATVADEPEPMALTSDFAGKVFGTDGRPAAGVEILTYHLATAALFAATTGDDGKFALAGLPLGYFDMAAKSADGLYVADQVAQVSMTGNFVELRLQELGVSARANLRAFTGANEAPVGIALLVDRRMKGPTFWRNPKGISTLAGGGALILVLLTGGGSDPPASPFMPPSP